MLAFKGVRSAPRFENIRKGLKPPHELFDTFCRLMPGMRYRLETCSRAVLLLQPNDPALGARFSSSPLTLTLLHRLDGCGGRQKRMCEKRKINQRCRIAIAPLRVLRRGGRIFRDGSLETLLPQFAQV
jgi:hypothetical protein